MIVTGDMRLSGQAESIFASGLPELGFEVIERAALNGLLAEVGLTEQGFLAEGTGTKRGQLQGIDGVFLGNSVGERSPMWTDTHLTMRLVEVGSGKTIWTVNAHDPRTMAVNMSEESSIPHTTKAALKALKKDLQAMPKS